MLLLRLLLLSDWAPPLSPQLQLSRFINFSLTGGPAPTAASSSPPWIWSRNFSSGNLVFFVLFTITQLPDWSTLWSSPK